MDYDELIRATKAITGVQYNVDHYMALFGHSRLFGWAAAFELIPAYFACIFENVSDVSRSLKKKLRASREKTQIYVVFAIGIPEKIFALREKLYLDFLNLNFVRSVNQLFTLQIT